MSVQRNGDDGDRPAGEGPTAVSEQATPPAKGRDQSEQRPRRGLFIPQDALLAIAIIAVAVLAGVLVAVTPTVGIPVGVSVAVAGLLYTMLGHWRGPGPN